MIGGVTGHRRLPAPVAERVGELFVDVLTENDIDVVVSSLAGGADQIFARLAREAQCALEVVIPCRGYETSMDGPERRRYAELLEEAVRVTTLPYPEPSPEAYLAAGIVTVERSDVLVAAWDGEPARGLGGTGDIVDYAASIGRDLVRLWPVDARR